MKFLIIVAVWLIGSISGWLFDIIKYRECRDISLYKFIESCVVWICASWFGIIVMLVDVLFEKIIYHFPEANNITVLKKKRHE